MWNNPNNVSVKKWLDDNDIGIQYNPKEIQISNITAYSAVNSAYANTCHIEWTVIPKLSKFYTFGVELCGESIDNSIDLFHKIVSKFKFSN